MFGTNKKAKYWDASRAYLITQLGLDTNATDAEINQALMDAENGNDEDDTDEATPTASPVSTATPIVATQASAPVAQSTTEPTMVSVADFNALKSEVMSLKSEVTALKKVPSLSLTNGKRETPPVAPSKKRAYQETAINQKHYSKVIEEDEKPFDDDDDDAFYKEAV
jgi:hypothetical protein